MNEAHILRLPVEGTYRRLEKAVGQIMKSLSEQPMRNRQLPMHALALIAFVLILTASVQPTDSAALNGPVGKHRQSSRDRGCFYMLQHYKNGEPIKTDEPCLNCTCENSMLMCYLRVCPYVKPAGDRCIIERVPGECCPRITCPDVAPPQENFEQETEPETEAPATSTSSSPAASPTDGSNTPQPILFGASLFAPSNTSSELTKSGGCMIGNNYYPEGAQMPSDSSKSCEVCYCIRGSAACVMQDCALEVSGCAPIYTAGGCCPTRYNCSAENAFTTPRPSLAAELSRKSVSQPGKKKFWDLSPTSRFTTLASEGISSLISSSSSTSTTTAAPIVLPDFGRASVTVPGPGCRAPNSTRVYADGERVPSRNKCEHCYCMRSELVCAVQECRPPCDGCVPIIDADDQCCPKRYECAAPTQRVPLDNVVLSDQESTPSLLTTPQLPRVTDSEPDASSGSPAASSPQPPQTPVDQTTVGSSTQSPMSEISTSPTSVAEQNFTLNDAASDQPRESSVTPFEANVSPAIDDVAAKEAPTPKQPEVSVMTTRQTKPPLRPISPKLSTNDDEIASELVPEKDLAKSNKSDASGTGGNVDGFNLNGEREQDQSEVGKSAGRVEAPEGSVPVASPAPDSYDIVPPSLTSTPRVVHSESSTPLPPASDIIERTNVTPDAQEEQNQQSGNNERKSRPLVVPSQIPGEGSCRYNNRLYENGQEVKSRHNCTELCMCINSVVYCDEIDCPRAPENPERCQKTITPGECCPKYVCPDETTAGGQTSSASSDITTSAPEQNVKSVSSTPSTTPELASQAFDVTSTPTPEISGESKGSSEPKAASKLPEVSETAAVTTSVDTSTSSPAESSSSTPDASVLGSTTATSSPADVPRDSSELSTRASPTADANTVDSEPVQPTTSKPIVSNEESRANPGVAEGAGTQPAAPEQPGAEPDARAQPDGPTESPSIVSSGTATSSFADLSRDSSNPPTQASTTADASTVAPESTQPAASKLPENQAVTTVESASPTTIESGSPTTFTPAESSSTSAAPVSDSGTATSIPADLSHDSIRPSNQASPAPDANTVAAESVQSTTPKFAEVSDTPAVTQFEGASPSTATANDLPTSSAAPVVTSDTATSSSDGPTRDPSESSTQASPTTDVSTAVPDTIQTTSSELPRVPETPTSTTAEVASSMTLTPVEASSTSATPNLVSTATSDSADLPRDSSESSSQANTRVDANTVDSGSAQSTTSEPVMSSEASSAKPAVTEGIDTQATGTQQSGAEPEARAPSDQTTESPPIVDGSTVTSSPTNPLRDSSDSPAQANAAADANTVASDSVQSTTSKQPEFPETPSVTMAEGASSTTSAPVESASTSAAPVSDGSTAASSSADLIQGSGQPSNETSPIGEANTVASESPQSTTSEPILTSESPVVNPAAIEGANSQAAAPEQPGAEPVARGQSNQPTESFAGAAPVVDGNTGSPSPSEQPRDSSESMTQASPTDNANTVAPESTQPAASKLPDIPAVTTVESASPTTIESGSPTTPTPAEPSSTPATPVVDGSTAASSVADLARDSNQSSTQASATTDANAVAAESVQSTTPKFTEVSAVTVVESAPPKAVEGAAPTTIDGASPTTADGAPPTTYGAPVEFASTSAAPVVESSTVTPSPADPPARDPVDPPTQASPTDEANTIASELAQSTTSKPIVLNEESRANPIAAEGAGLQPAAPEQSGAEPDAGTQSNEPTESSPTSSAPVLDVSTTASPVGEFVTSVTSRENLELKPDNLMTVIPSIGGSEAAVTISRSDTNSSSTSPSSTNQAESISTTTTVNSQPVSVNYTDSPPPAGNDTTQPELATSQATLVDPNPTTSGPAEQDKAVVDNSTTPASPTADSNTISSESIQTTTPNSQQTTEPVSTSPVPVGTSPTTGEAADTKFISTTTAESGQPLEPSTPAAPIIDSSALLPDTSKVSGEQTTPTSLRTDSITEASESIRQSDPKPFETDVASSVKPAPGETDSAQTISDPLAPAGVTRPVESSSTSAASVVDSAATSSTAGLPRESNGSSTQASPLVDVNTVISESAQSTTSQPIVTNEEPRVNPVAAEGSGAQPAAPEQSAADPDARAQSTQSTESPPVVNSSEATTIFADLPRDSSAPTTQANPTADAAPDSIHSTESKPLEVPENLIVTAVESASSTTVETAPPTTVDAVSSATSTPVESPTTSAAPIVDSSTASSISADLPRDSSVPTTQASAKVDENTVESVSMEPSTSKLPDVPDTTPVSTVDGASSSTVDGASPATVEAASPTTSAPAESSSTPAAPVVDSDIATSSSSDLPRDSSESSTQASPTTDANTFAAESVQPTVSKLPEATENRAVTVVDGASPTTSTAESSSTSVAPIVDSSTAAPSPSEQPRDSSESITQASPTDNANTVTPESNEPTASKLPETPTVTTVESGSPSTSTPTESSSTPATPVVDSSTAASSVADLPRDSNQSSTQASATTDANAVAAESVQSTTPKFSEVSETPAVTIVESAPPKVVEGAASTTIDGASPTTADGAPPTTYGAPVESASTSAAPVVESSTVTPSPADPPARDSSDPSTQASPTADANTVSFVPVDSTTSKLPEITETPSVTTVEGAPPTTSTPYDSSPSSSGPAATSSTITSNSADLPRDSSGTSTQASSTPDPTTVASESVQPTTFKLPEVSETPAVSIVESASTPQPDAESVATVKSNETAESSSTSPAPILDSSTTASPADEFVTSVTALKNLEFKPVNLTTVIPSIRGSEAAVTIPWADISNSSPSPSSSSTTTTTINSQPVSSNYTELPPAASDASTEPEFSTSQATVVDTSKLHSGNQTRTLAYDTTTQVSVGAPEADYEDVAGEPGCEYEGKAYTSAQQIPRAHPCDFCFCFRGDIICLQQTCPPPVPHCFETVVDGFCCPRYECPVHTVRTAQNSTSNGGLTITPYETHSRLHSHTHGLEGNATQLARGSPSNVKGCFVDNKLYGVGKVIESASGPCLECRCDRSGMMRCNPKECTPEDPLLQQINREVLSSTLSRSQRRRR